MIFLEESNYLKDSKELMKEYDYDKNTEFNLDKLTLGSDKKVWWKCSKGHNWQAGIGSRYRSGASCPFCSNQKVLKGYNDLMTTNKNLAKEWDYEKNINITPYDVIGGSNKKVWWKCLKGHSWQASIGSRNSGSGCPYCSNQKVLPGYNDLANTNPALASEWNYDKNGDLKPTMITANSNKKVWWKCKNNHEWMNSPNGRNKRGCPYCSNQKIWPGYNDLETTNPEILKEWDYSKNEVLPTEILAGSEKLVWWVCNNGHSYKMRVYLKAKNNHRCPICNRGKHTSFPEKALAYYIQKIDNSIIEGYSNSEKNISEIDIYIPSKKIGIEYDGARWHSSKNLPNDIRKNKICAENKIKLYRIRENKCPSIPNSSSFDIYYDSNNIEEYNRVISQLITKIYNKKIDINIKRDELKIYAKIDLWYLDNSAINLPATVLEEWDFEKNMGLKPSNYSGKTHRTVWWKCSTCDGSWRASIANRANGRGCPYCSGHKLLSGYNDLATVNPELLKEWDYKKNIIIPSNVTAHSGKTAWWICSKGHSYQSKISNRNDLDRGCPICANKRIVVGINDLETLYPEIFEEWDFEKNKLNPYNLAPGTSKKVYFKCKNCGYQWQTTLGARIKGSGCPICANKKKGEILKIPINQYTKDNRFIATYGSTAEAEKETGISRSAICQALKGRAKTSGGYIWKYKKSDDKE